MEKEKSIKLGYTIDPWLLSELFQNRILSYDKLIEYLSSKINQYGGLLLLLKQYLEQKLVLGTTEIVFDFESSAVSLNGTLTGLLQKINRSEVDVGVQPFILDEILPKIVDFSYPFKLNEHIYDT